MLLHGHSRCTLGDLPRSLALRPKITDTGLEPEDQLEILVLHLAHEANPFVLRRQPVPQPAGMAHEPQGSVDGLGVVLDDDDRPQEAAEAPARRKERRGAGGGELGGAEAKRRVTRALTVVQNYHYNILSLSLHTQHSAPLGAWMLLTVQ